MRHLLLKNLQVSQQCPRREKGMKTGVITAVFAALLMATLGIFSRKIALNAEVVIFFRLFFGSLFLLALLFLQGKIDQICCWPDKTIVCSGFFLAAFAGCYFKAMSLTTLANAVLILYLAPVTASVFTHFFMGERLRPVNMLLIALALLGFATMMEFQLHFSQGESKGLLFALLSMFGYAAFICCNRTIPAEIRVYTKTFYQLVAGTICIFPLAISGGLYQASHYPGETWLWLAAVGLFPGFLGIMMAVWSLEKLPAVTFGTLSYLEPIFVVFFGWFLFAEELSPLQTMGCGLILASGILTGVLATKEKNSKELSDTVEKS